MWPWRSNKTTISLLTGTVISGDKLVTQNRHSRPQRLRSFWSAPRITTSGLEVRDSQTSRQIWLAQNTKQILCTCPEIRSGQSSRSPAAVDQKDSGLWSRGCKIESYFNWPVIELSKSTSFGQSSCIHDTINRNIIWTCSWSDSGRDTVSRKIPLCLLQAFLKQS